MRLATFATMIAAACLTLLGSCSGRATHQDSLPAGNFSLQILPDTYVAGGRAAEFTISQRAAGSLLALEVEARQARGLQAAFFELDYDPQLFSPQRVEGSPSLLVDETGLELSLISEPGRLEYGAMRIRPSVGDAGLSGDVALATVYFERRPFAGTRRVSAPPRSNSSRATLRYDSGSGMLHWDYYNHGDYNQDGRVAVSDLTPIGIRFLDPVPVGTDPDGRDSSSIEDVIDGSNDGVINVQDLSAIGQNFGNQVASYDIFQGNPELYYPASNDAPSTLVTLRFELMSSALGNPGLERLRFASTGPPPDPGEAYWVRPLDADGFAGTPSNTSTETAMPIWHLSVVDLTEESGYWGSRLLARSYGSDEVPCIVYSRGVDEELHLAGGTSPLGLDLAPLIPITVSPAFQFGTNFAALTVVGAFVDVAFSNFIGLEYYVSINGIESFAYGGTIDSADETGQGINGVEVAGAAAYTYYQSTTDPNDGLLVYNRAGPGGFAPIIVSGGFGTFDHGLYSSLAVIDGRPAIAFYDIEFQRLLYIRAEDAEGAVWPSSNIVVEEAGPGIASGIGVDLFELEGRPAVVYGEQSGFGDRVIYKGAEDAAGASWPGAGVFIASIDHDTSSNRGYFAAEADGLGGASVAYRRDEGQVYCRRIADAAGSLDAEELVDSAPGNTYIYLAYLNGNPAITYTRDGLRFAIRY